MPERPRPSWSLQRLAEYTHSGLTEIQRAGRHTAAQTYRIGCALYYARLKLLVEGKWNQWLTEQAIPLQTAWEAIKLYEAVKAEDELQGLTSTEAKVKYGIYSDWQDRQSRNGSGGNAGSGKDYSIPSGSESPRSDEDCFSLAFHRLSTAHECLQTIEQWRPEVLYSTEADEILRLAKEILLLLLGKRKTVSPPKQKRVQGKLSELDNL